MESSHESWLSGNTESTGASRSVWWIKALYHMEKNSVAAPFSFSFAFGLLRGPCFFLIVYI
jgi:hypothetical protein